MKPKSTSFIGAGDYDAIGKEFLNYFVNLCELKPQHSVLDIGCGIGRMAMPLTGYLTNGDYFGFDVHRQGINWCIENISSKFSNFTFHHVDLYSQSYNPQGTVKAAEYIFPYDQIFDFVFLTSVFTHMLPEEVAHYLSEIDRVLKPGGTCLATFFIIFDDRAPDPETTSIYFHKVTDDYWVKDFTRHDRALAYNMETIVHLCGNFSMDVHEGSWTCRTGYNNYQDIVILKK